MTFPAWIDSIGGIRVERMEGPRPGGQAYLYLKLSTDTARVIWHTTEGSSVEGAVARLREQFSAPHFVIGPDRIVQMRPLWAQAATVRGDNSNAWQVEVVGFSKTTPWLPEAPTRRPFVALLRFFNDRLGVPLARPDGWKDDCSDIEGVWATEGNSRRRSGRATTFRGHVMHLEWPGNTHWDQGAIRWSDLLEEARDDMTDAERERLATALENSKKAVAIVNAVEDFLEGTPPPDTASIERKRTYKALVEAGSKPKPGAHDHDEKYVAKGTTITL